MATKKTATQYKIITVRAEHIRIPERSGWPFGKGQAPYNKWCVTCHGLVGDPDDTDSEEVQVPHFEPEEHDDREHALSRAFELAVEMFKPQPWNQELPLTCGMEGRVAILVNGDEVQTLTWEDIPGPAEFSTEYANVSDQEWTQFAVEGERKTVRIETRSCQDDNGHPGRPRTGPLNWLDTVNVRLDSAEDELQITVKVSTGDLLTFKASRAPNAGGAILVSLPKPNRDKGFRVYGHKENGVLILEDPGNSAILIPKNPEPKQKFE